MLLEHLTQLIRGLRVDYVTWCIERVMHVENICGTCIDGGDGGDGGNGDDDNDDGDNDENDNDDMRKMRMMNDAYFNPEDKCPCMTWSVEGAAVPAQPNNALSTRGNGCRPAQVSHSGECP